jgi:hypothetical protein
MKMSKAAKIWIDLQVEASVKLNNAVRQNLSSF